MDTLRISRIVAALCAIVLCYGSVGLADPVGTAFTYQGRLIDSNEPANGSYDFQFRLYDANSEGNKAGGDVNVPDVDVVDGYFTAELDFGSGVFDGNDCWLEVAVRPGEQSDPNIYTTLAPRRKVTAAPHALYARTAEELKGGISWGMVADKPAGFSDGIDDVGLVSESDPQVSSAIANVLAKWNGTTLIDSGIYESGGNVGIGTTSPAGRLEVVNFLPSGNIAQDQSQTSVDSEDSEYSIWQVFTPAVTGQLTHVALVTRDPYEICVLGICGWNPASATLYIYTGSWPSGTPIATQSISITGGGYDGNSWAWISYTVSSHPYLVSGQQYTFKITLTSGMNDRSWCRYISSGDYYPGGVSGLGSSADFEFATYMNAYSNQSAMVVTSAGSVGIGTAAPTQKLDVAGNALVSGNVGIGTASPTAKLDINGTAKATAFVGNGSGLTNLPLDTDWTLSEPNVYRTAGNVGIGTASPTAKLEVNGTVKATTFVGDGSGLTNLPVNTDWTLSEPNVYRIAGNVGIGTASPSQKLDVAGSAIFSGNVGIGTTSPAATLDVNGDAKVGGKRVVVGEENLRIIRGTVSVGGGVLAGSGFSATHPSTGFYHVTFDTAFSSRPSVTATWKYQDADDFGATGTSSNVYTICVIAVDSTHFRIKTQGTSGGAVNVAFEFTAVGPR